MRFLALTLSLLVGVSVQAQESYASFGAGPATDGASVRLVGGLDRGPVTGTLRLSVGGGDIDNPDGSDRPYTRGRVEFGVGIARVQPVAGPLRVEGHLGLAYALATGDEEEEFTPLFDFPDLGFGLTAPIEATALLKLTDRMDLGITASRSFTLVHASSEDDPNLRALVPSLQQGGVTFGLRFH